MISSLYVSMEDELGVAATRLCRVFQNRSHSRNKFKRFCCIPVFVLVVIMLMLVISGAIFVRVKGIDMRLLTLEEKAFIATLGFVVGLSLLASSVTWVRIVWNLIKSPSSRILSIMNASKRRNFDPKVESVILKLKQEVEMIAHTIRTIDAFSHSCTRLVVIIDGLDSCEQAKVVQILEIVHVLFTKEDDPFISILAVDPHVLIKGIEGNLTEVFRNGTVNGHDYLRTIIHLPVFLQLDLSKTKAITQNHDGYLKRQNSTVNHFSSFS